MAATDEDEGEWAARLAPWAAALRECLRADAKVDELSPARSFPWLEVALPCPSGDEQQDDRELVLMRQAIELLGLLAFKSHRAWKALLRAQCEVDASDDELFGVAQVAPRFLFLLDGDSGADVARSCARLFSSDYSSHNGDFALQDEEFARIRRDLLATPTDRSTAFAVGDDGELNPLQVAVCLEFAPCFVGRDAVVQYLTSVRSIVASMKQQQSNAWFALDSVRLATNSIELNSTMGDVLADLVRMGVKMSMLAFTLDESGVHSRLETREALGSILSCLLSIPQNGHTLVERVSLLALRANVHQFAALLSAFVETAFANGVDLILDEECADSRGFKWKWIAYSVFRASSTVRKVEIYDQFLVRGDVEAMRRLLNSADPSSLLSSPQYAPGLAASQREQQDTEYVYYIHVKPNTRMSLEPLRNVIGWVGKTVEIKQAARLRAMVYDELIGHVEVMMPGYGQCWVYLRDVVSVEKLRIADTVPSASTESSAQHQVTSLTVGLLGNTVRDPLALRGLMNLVGGPLRRLSLYQKEPLVHQEVQAILRSCPNLQHLKLHNVDVDSMDVFIDAYERHPSRYMSTLILESYRTSSESLHRFAELLATPRSLVARCLRELCLRSPTDVNAIDERCIRAFLKVLESNTSLEYLELRVRPSIYEQFATAFQSHHGELLNTVRRTVPRECKYAFLEAAYAVERRIEQPNLVHERLLAPIFEYAATRATRTVLLRAGE